VPYRKVVYHNHYDIVSNQVLWFLQHYLFEHSAAFPTFAQILHAWENGYAQANAAKDPSSIKETAC
jgi:trehalose 6-phosphate synthase